MKKEAGPPPSTMRSQLKTTQTLEFPKGTDAALEDIDAWLREFDRVVSHVSSAQGLLPEDRIAHLLAAWPRESLVGEHMRLDQQTPEYQAVEVSNALESCWAMLLKRLRSYSVEPALARAEIMVEFALAGRA